MEAKNKKILIASLTALLVVGAGLAAWLLLGQSGKKSSAYDDDEEEEEEEAAFSLTSGYHCYEDTQDGGRTCRIAFDYDGKNITSAMFIDTVNDQSIALEGSLSEKNLELSGTDFNGRGIVLSLSYNKDGSRLEGTANLPTSGEMKVTLSESGWRAAAPKSAAEKLGLTGTLKKMEMSGWEWIVEYQLSRSGEITFVSSAAEGWGQDITFENGVPKTRKETDDGGETYTHSSYTYTVEGYTGHLVEKNRSGKTLKEISVTYDPAGRIVRIGDDSFTYDANGNAKDKDGHFVFMELEFMEANLTINKDARVKAKDGNGRVTKMRHGPDEPVITATIDFADYTMSYYD